MRLRDALAALAALLVMVCASDWAWAACPAFPPPEATRTGGQMATTIMGEMKRVRPPTRHLPIPRGPLSSVRIGLARDGCLGTCPIYRVDIRGDGTGAFHGEGYVLVRGDHSFRLPPGAVQCLLDDFRAADFWSLAPKYQAAMTDAAYYRVTLEIAGRRKTVDDYLGALVGMPNAVTALERAIDAAVGDRFVVGDDQTMDALRADHFDFKSQAGGALLAGAAATGPDDLVLALIAAGAPVHGRPVKEYRGDNAPAIIAAARRGRVRVVRALMAAGAFDGVEANLKTDAYLAAAAALDEGALVELLSAKPDINARGSDGKTALMVLDHDDQTAPEQLALNGPRQVAIAKRLLALGADATLRDRAGETALYFVTAPELVPLLTKAGAPLETRNAYGWTPLLAVGTDDAAVALLKAGADPHAVSDDGATVFKTATERKWAHTLAFLAAHGVTR
jgi:ankyrin repeat protein